ncbi:MAG TPA: response regulator transcription factor, partial [Rhizobium sp.]|nr:response regulator transcription factor [Rhizobium sp.]
TMTPPQNPPFRVVILKADLLYGEMLARLVKQFRRGAQAEVYQKGFDALEAIQNAKPDLFITGAHVEDMDGFEHLEPFVEDRLPILVVTSRRDPRTLALLRALRFNGLFDVHRDGHTNFNKALETVIEGRTYISDTFQPHLKRPRRITLDELTQTEELVLSAIGDGSDDQEAAERLGLSPLTVNTHRKAIMGKRGIHQRGELVRHAVQMGYVHMTPERVIHPGFDRRLVRKSREQKPPEPGDNKPA